VRQVIRIEEGLSPNSIRDIRVIRGQKVLGFFSRLWLPGTSRRRGPSHIIRNPASSGRAEIVNLDEADTRSAILSRQNRSENPRRQSDEDP
jgi:hypothetical protein